MFFIYKLDIIKINWIAISQWLESIRINVIHHVNHSNHLISGILHE